MILRFQGPTFPDPVFSTPRGRAIVERSVTEDETTPRRRCVVDERTRRNEEEKRGGEKNERGEDRRSIGVAQCGGHFEPIDRARSDCTTLHGRRRLTGSLRRPQGQRPAHADPAPAAADGP